MLHSGGARAQIKHSFSTIRPNRVRKSPGGYVSRGLLLFRSSHFTKGQKCQAVRLGNVKQMWAPWTLGTEKNMHVPCSFKTKRGQGHVACLFSLSRAGRSSVFLDTETGKGGVCLWKKSYRPKEGGLMLKFHWQQCFPKPLKHFHEKLLNPTAETNEILYVG